MLQCSKYKALEAFHARQSSVPIHPSFTKKTASGQRPAGPYVVCGMGQYAGVQNLRDLLSTAGKLRYLADDAADKDDRALYLQAAEALEARAKWLATTLPEDRQPRHNVIPLHRPVSLLI